jgi:hypothetical protein
MEEPDDVDDDNDDDLSLLEAILAREPLAALRAIVEERPHLIRAQVARLHGITPLHLAAHVCLPFESVHFLYRGWPHALRATYRGSLLPIHCLAASPNLVAVVNEDDSNYDRESSLSPSQQQQNIMKTARFFIEEWPGSLRERDDNRRLPLHRALRNRRAPLELIRRLVQSCPETVRERGGPSEQWTFPLHDAVTTKRKRPRKLPVVQFVFEAWPDAINARDAVGRLPIHVAAAHPKIAPSVLRFLVDRGPASALQQRDNKLRVPLLLAASAGAHEHARILVEARPESARERNHEGRTPLHIAVASKKDDGDDDDESDSASPDEWANGVAELALLFVDQWPESAHERDPTRDGRTPLHVAVASFARGGPALLRLLAERSPQSLRTTDYKGRLPLHLADCLESARILLECCPEAARVQDRDGRLPAHAVIAAVSRTAAKLQQNGPAEGTEENIPPPEEWPLRVAQLLVEAHPESLLAQDRKNGWVPLHAVLFDKRAPLDAVAFLIEAQPLALQVPDRVGRLPLHMWLTIEDGWYPEPEAVPRLNLGPSMLDMARMLVET